MATGGGVVTLLRILFLFWPQRELREGDRVLLKSGTEAVVERVYVHRIRVRVGDRFCGLSATFVVPAESARMLARPLPGGPRKE